MGTVHTAGTSPEVADPVLRVVLSVRCEVCSDYIERFECEVDGMCNGIIYTSRCIYGLSAMSAQEEFEVRLRLGYGAPTSREVLALTAEVLEAFARDDAFVAVNPEAGEPRPRGTITYDFYDDEFSN